MSVQLSRQVRNLSFVQSFRQVSSSMALLLAMAVTATANAGVTSSELLITAPEKGASSCSTHDFGAVQIRIGLHATLRACYRNISIKGEMGTAFVTVPREFEGRSVSRDEFDALRADIVKSENAMYQRARNHRKGREPVAQARPKPIPLGVFDHDTNRVGYAYAYAVPRIDDNGQSFTQAMMRLESFVLVRDRVLVLMMIAPVRDGDDAAETFEISEKWARSIVSSNLHPVAAEKPVETGQQDKQNVQRKTELAKLT